MKYLPIALGILLIGQLPAAAQGPALDEAGVAARLNRLEAETDALRNELQWLRENPVRLPAVEATPASSSNNLAPAAGDGDYFTLAELQAEMKKLAWKKGDFSIVPYGFLWGNMVYASARTTPGSYTLYVPSATLAARERVRGRRPQHAAGLRRRRPADPLLQLRAKRRQGGDRLPEQRAEHREQGHHPAPPCLLGSEGRGVPPPVRADVGRDLAVVPRHVDVLGGLGRRQHRLPPGAVPRRTVPGLRRVYALDVAGLGQSGGLRRLDRHGPRRDVELADPRDAHRRDAGRPRQGRPARHLRRVRATSAKSSSTSPACRR